MASTKPVLVTGATGAQGGAAVRHLLRHGHAVRILTRNPDMPAALALEQAGAQVCKGDMDDRGSVEAAMLGVTGVFSVQVPDTQGNDSERRHGLTLVQAAVAAGVRQFVHTSVARAGEQNQFPRWDSGYWSQKYWNDKSDIEAAVRAAGFVSWTVLKPAFMMDNFALPKAKFMFPHLRQGQILTALLPDTRMQLIAAEDVGAFAHAAFDNPERFNRQDIPLAVQALTMGEVAATLSRVLGKKVEAASVTPEEAVAQGLFPGWVRSQEWTNEVSYGVDLAAAANHGVVLTPFDAWVESHRRDIVVDVR